MSHNDSSVFERRLRPIYDNLEVGNNRKALQETEKVLKKHPNLLCAKALKGLALLRLGRHEESHGYLKAVAEEKPVDDSTLQVLSFCYKEMEQLEKIVELYAHAVKQTPGNEELLAHLFISHVRMEDFKAQQSVALQLYKIQPKSAYYFWAVMSVVLQGIRGPESSDPKKRQIYLALAQRMVDKLLQDNKLENEQEVLLYLHILKLQEKHKEALEFLNGPICARLYPGAPIYMKIDLLKKLNLWQEVNALLKNLLKNDRDRWDYYKDYIASCFELVPENSASIDGCREFLCQLIETTEKKVRGPYLARLELQKRLYVADTDPKEQMSDIFDHILEYFRLFGDKSCCTHDIMLFLPHFNKAHTQELASKMLLESGISSTTLPQSKEQMQKHICALQISRICGSHLDLETDHLLAFYTALKLHYEHGLSAFGRNLLSTDMGPSDPYALLAANVMYDISMKEQKSDRLFEALCLLQYVLRNSTSNFHVKLLSLKIYHMFGCLLGAQEMYDYLDIKQIQLDSMGYIHCNYLPLCGRFSMARSVFDTTLKFFNNSYKERLEYISLTYRFCTFSKLEEFMDFKKRLTNSIHYIVTTVEVQLCDLVMFYGNVTQNLQAYTAMNIEAAKDPLESIQLTDNRDLSAMVRWDPYFLISDTAREDSLKQEYQVLQIRILMLRLVASFVDLFHHVVGAKFVGKVTNCTNENNDSLNQSTSETGTIEMLRDNWVKLFKLIRTTNLEPLPNRFLADLLPTRLHLLLGMPYEKFFTDLADFVLNLYNGASNLPLQCKVISDNVEEMVRLCSGTIQESNNAVEDGLWRRREWQNKVAACLEILSLYAFLLSVFHEKMQTPIKTKPKKKTVDGYALNQTISEKERSQLIVELMRHLKKHLQLCENSIKDWKVPSLPRDLSSYMADMSLKPEVEATLISDVASTFKESHELMVAEMRNLIKDKIRMVSK